MSAPLAGERVLVVGAGVAGRSAAAVLLDQGASVVVTDRRPGEDLDDIPGAELRGGGHRPEDLDDVTLVVVSPGVSPTAEVLSWADARGVPVWGEMELGARLVTGPYLAVTGTNGKTTTAGLIEACLRADGLDAVACGNIGRPFPQTATEHHEALVVEVSSFQLAFQESLHPRVSVLLNVAPDHLDWHGSFEDYAAAKARLWRLQGPGDVHVGNRDDDLAASLSATALCPTSWFRRGEPAEGEVGYVGDQLVSRLDGEVRLGSVDDRVAGFRANAAAAACASLAFGAEPDAITEGIRAFELPRHRGEVVARIGDVRFVDNSKATNVHAALAALEGLDDVVLIAGGRSKGQDLSPLGTAAGRLRGVVAIGESAADVAGVFAGLVPFARAPSIEDAVRHAYASAGSSSWIVLAPACASWDQFADYAERGDRFRDAALRIAGEVGADARS